jgi:hypothetical protein
VVTAGQTPGATVPGMADIGRTEPLENVISLVAAPIAAVIRQADQMRKGADEVMRALENFNSTMENLNETAARINRLLNDFEEPVRAMLPQLTRTVKLADELSNRLAGPVDQVAPGLARLAETLNSPVLASFPRDLSQFMDIINDLGRRMSPLAQLAEQAGGMFGLRIPGLGTRPSSPAPPHGLASRPAGETPAAAPSGRGAAGADEDDVFDDEDVDEFDEPAGRLGGPGPRQPAKAAARKRSGTKRSPAKKATTKRTSTKRSATKQSTAKSATRRSSR